MTTMKAARALYANRVTIREKRVVTTEKEDEFGNVLSTTSTVPRKRERRPLGSGKSFRAWARNAFMDIDSDITGKLRSIVHGDKP